MQKLILGTINIVINQINLIKRNLWDGFGFLLNQYIDKIIINNYDIIYNRQVKNNNIIYRQTEIHMLGFEMDLAAKQYRVINEMLEKYNIDIHKKNTILNFLFSIGRNNLKKRCATIENITIMFNEIASIPNIIEIMTNNDGISTAKKGIAYIPRNKKELNKILPNTFNNVRTIIALELVVAPILENLLLLLVVEILRYSEYVDFSSISFSSSLSVFVLGFLFALLHMGFTVIQLLFRTIGGVLMIWPLAFSPGNVLPYLLSIWIHNKYNYFLGSWRRLNYPLSISI